MGRIKLVIAALAVVGASFAAFAGPAMADDLNCRDAQGTLIRCDGQFFAPVSDVNNNGFTLFNSGFGFPGFGAFGNGINTFDNINGFDGINNGFDTNGIVQTV